MLRGTRLDRKVISWCAGAAWLGAALAGFSAAPASAEIRIRHDPGGQIGHYLYAGARMREAGERLVVDGPCLSACTLLLAVVPADRVCVTPRAVLGFHAAWTPDQDGRPVTNPEATKLLWATYTPRMRNVIARKGGLSRRMIVVRGRELASLYQPCR